uniref:Protein C10 n=1 Tax=Globisporangium ultimum (strain ATCC 200006 / CBS 805.95 / DAOM BR144) TaxID=431595 RepID=K3W4X3_GLOUD
MAKKPEAVDKGVCVACGSRNVIRYEPKRYDPQQQFIQCRSCSLVSPSFNRPCVQSGSSEDYTPLDNFKAQIMGDEILDAFTHDHVKKQLQSALDFAQGDIALIFSRYLPVAIDAIQHVVTKYGFSASVEGVMESVRVMQTLAKDDEQLVQRLVRLRQVLTPTGAWIKEDADTEQNVRRKLQAERDVIRQKQQDAERAEQITAENARKAKLRARKLALRLDPSVPCVPVLHESPPPMLVAHMDRPVRLRVNAQHTQKFQWYFNGKPIQADNSNHGGSGILVRGATRSTLIIPKLTKRFVGEYYCVCENEEGVTSTASCQVTIVALTSRRLPNRKLRGLVTSTLQLCWKDTAIACVAHSIVVFDTHTFAPAKVLPAISPNGPGTTQTLAWNPYTKLLLTSSSMKNRRNDVVVHSIDFTPTAADGATAPEEHRRGLIELVKSKAPPKAAVSAVGTSAISNLLFHTTEKALDVVHFAAFFAQGKLLILSNMKSRILLLESVPSSPHSSPQQILDFDGDRICHIASSSPSAVLAIAFRGKRHISLVKSQSTGINNNAITMDTWTREHLEFAFPVTCSAFDTRGEYLAVAESSCVKAWLSIVAVHRPTTKANSIADSSSRESTRKRRFEAHVGKVSCLQWTKATSLLVSSGFDGYVKIWEIDTHVTCLLTIHLDTRGIYSFLLVDEDAVLFALGYTECRLQSRQLVQLVELEASRQLEMNARAAMIQKIWKGRQTRALINKYIKGSLS